MPVDFLGQPEARRWGRFAGEPTTEQLDRFFHLDPDDLKRARERRDPATVLGFAIQLGTVRFLGTFLADVEDTPATVVSYVARQLGIEASGWAAYARSRVRRLHAIEIRRLYGYADFGEGLVHLRFLRWVLDRAWAADEPPSQLLDNATGWLVEHKVVLPGVTTLARLVAQVRDRAARRGWRLLANQVSGPEHHHHHRAEHHRTNNEQSADWDAVQDCRLKRSLDLANGCGRKGGPRTKQPLPDGSVLR